MEPVIEAKNISKKFVTKGKRTFYAVKEVNFQLFPGEALGIVGESGSGKSTLAKLVTHLIDPSEGTLFFHGEDLSKAKGKALKEYYGTVQMVFQDPVGSFNPRKTLGYGIGESLRNRGVKKAEVEKTVGELLVQCGLEPEFASRYPYEVSGGQCQRAAIARALAVNPRVLICDEATSALDVTVQKQIMELLIKLQKERGLAFLFICHNLALVQMFCSQVLVLHDGEAVEQGTPDQVINQPTSAYTRELIDSVLA